MDIAVKFWASEIDKPVGMPDNWPSEVKENHDTSPGPDWVLMSGTDYVAYRAQHQAEYEAWEATQV